MPRLSTFLLTICEGITFFAGSSIIFCGLGLIFSSILNSSIIAGIVLGGWFLSGSVTLWVLIRAFKKRKQFIEAFDHDDTFNDDENNKKTVELSST